MAIGPDGRPLEAPLQPERHGLGEDDLRFLQGLEGIIDRALRSHPAGSTFVYGIHQGLRAEAVDALLDRYRAAGWAEARARPIETGALTLILIP